MRRPWRPLLGLILSRSKSAEIAALVRTTAAVVDIRTTPAGDNVLPDTIYISFNFRTLPGMLTVACGPDPCPLHAWPASGADLKVQSSNLTHF